MSVQAISWALAQEASEDTAATFVLVCLANYCNAEGEAAFPSVETICRHTRLSERSVRSKLDDLEALGLIEKGDQAVVEAYIKRKDRRPVCYNLNLERGANTAPREATGCKPEQDGVQMVQERGAPVAPDPSKKTVRDPREVFEVNPGEKPKETIKRLGIDKVLGKDFAKRFGVVSHGTQK